MIRIGQGFDVHQLVEGRECMVGGVKIPYEKGLLGHSDADVLLHAIIDALLGACGLGDIGHFFPDSDVLYKDADSLILLQEIWQKLKKMEVAICNIDCTILAEKPKMYPYLAEMKEKIAETCEIEKQQVNLKATTMETMGFIGRNEGIGAMAIVLIEKNF